VGEPAEGFAAVGCGYAEALGALWVERHKKPRHRAVTALDAAVHLNAGVRGPFVVEETK
jgi:hypothetical protein